MTSLEGEDLSGIESLANPLQECGIHIRVEVKGSHPDQFLSSVAEALAGLPVDVKNLVFLIVHEECVGRVVHDSAKARLALAQLFFGLLAFRNIDRRAKQLNDISSVIQDRVPNDMNISDGAVGQRHLVLVGRVYSFTERLLKVPFHPGSILGEDSSKKRFPGRYTFLGIESKHSEHLLRPVKPFVTGHVPSPTTGVGESLRFGQVSLAAAQRLRGALALGDVTSDSEIESPAAIFQIFRADLHRKSPAVFRAMAAFEIQGTLHFESVPVLGPTLFGEIEIDVRHAHSEQFLASVPQAATALFVCVAKTRLLVDQEHRIVCVV